MENFSIVLAAAIEGLCSSSETSTRSPKSIAEKAWKIAREVEKLAEKEGSAE